MITHAENQNLEIHVKPFLLAKIIMKSTWAISLLSLSVYAHPVFAEPTVIKVKLAEATFPLLQPERADWMRMEVEGANIKLMHSTQVLDGFWGVYNWHDHPPIKVAFRPEGCEEPTSDIQEKLAPLKSALDAGKITSQDYETQKKNLLNEFTSQIESPCSIKGKDALSLREGMDVRKGMWTVDYIESNQSKSVTFKVPTESSKSSEPSTPEKNRKR
jgi:DMAP1-binding Domain